jgi:hypothetical protein
MAVYLLYCLRRDGHIQRGQSVECDDDDQALARAAELKHAHGIEVWRNTRRVGLVDGRS